MRRCTERGRLVASNILFVFEGEVTEKRIWNVLEGFYFKGCDIPVVCAIYGGEIYSLFHKLKADPDLDLFSVLKARDKNSECLGPLSRDEISEIYLFFDYDGHATAASDEKISEMLDLFCEETDKGKLYISYPMVEALRHHNPDIDFRDVTAECKKKIGYKSVVHQTSSAAYRDVTSYSERQWAHVCSEHCRKLNGLMIDRFEFPEEYFDQSSVFRMQLEKHIGPKSEVAVLSAFPIFFLDYYGRSEFNRMLRPDQE